MPELPEVETTRRGIEPHLVDQQIKTVTVRQRQLRWPVPADLEKNLTGSTIQFVQRRAKYLLIATGNGTAILHLGMSGSLRIVAADEPLRKHDHVDIGLNSGRLLRFHDPRRFGALLWTVDPPEHHPLLAKLGPEPLGNAFHGDHLHRHSRARKIPVKQLIMDGKIVVGVGNIYASEALFLAGIDPRRAAGRVSAARYDALAQAIRTVLRCAIEQGGTTLRDFVNSTGEPGYFAQHLNVYDRAKQPCRVCATPIRSLRLGQRSTFYCVNCQR